VLVIGAACLWATSGVLTKEILVRYAPPPLALAFWRDCLTFIVLVLALGLFHRNWLRLDMNALLPLLGLGIIGLGAFHVLWVYAVAWIGVAQATVLNYTAPAFVVLITWLLWREPITWRQVAAVLLTFAGCLLLVRLYDFS
jgi:drug/metabolite transporter, DME family